MRRHIATYRASRTYRHLETFNGRTEDETRIAALTHSTPTPWLRGWKPLSTSAVRFDEVNQYGVEVSCDMTWSISLPIWESDPVKARRMAEDEAEKHDLRDLSPDRMAPKDWNSREGLVEIVSLKREPNNTRLRHGFDVPWRHLLSTDQGWWPYELEIDQAFDAYRQLVVSAKGYEQQLTWHRPTTHMLLSGQRREWHGYRSDGVEPVTSIVDLRERFQAALLGTAYDFYETWRQDHGYALDATLAVKATYRGKWWRDMPTVAGSRPFERATPREMLEDMLTRAAGMTLTPQLNSVHAGARNIERIGVDVGERGFSIIVSYGFEGSIWDECIARTRGGEPFMDTLARAYRLFRSDLVPDFKEQIETRRLGDERARLIRLGVDPDRYLVKTVS